MEDAELIAVLREVRDRVRARHPDTAAPGDIPLPDLMPLVHARDAALGKVASIGTVNPRRGGALNAFVQAGKRAISRILDWHVREQVVFNRKVMDCLDAAIEALDQNNRALHELATRIQIAGELKDLRSHWAEWRAEWQRKLEQNEIQFLRTVAELQGAFQHRVAQMDTSYRESVKTQHTDFQNALERARLEYERLIHSELRVLRQRMALDGAPSGGMQPGGSQEYLAQPGFDYTRFAERFRGPEAYVKSGQQVYLPYFAGRRNVLDIGCGRGEFLELMLEAGIPARGIDLSAEAVALCRHKGLQAEQTDLFDYLSGQPEGAFDGIFSAQVVEHLPPERLPQMIQLTASRLARDGVLAIETPNPECLAIFASHFYLDPTHTRPVPPELMIFYFEESGVGAVEVKKLAPARESMPAVASLPEDFRERFFGGLDYAVIGRKL